MEFDSMTWAVAKGTHDGHPLLIRFRKFPLDFSRVSFPVRLNLFWQMTDIDEHGWPSDSEFQRLEVFEDRLVEAVEHDSQSLLTVVLTCNGEKEFVFQSTDSAVFLSRLTNMPQEKRRYPVSIHSNMDPEWEY